jgi:hypothetical protein
MTSPELLWICVTAFAAVGVILAVLAAIMRLILVVFPQTEEEATDPMVIASVATVLQTLYPGTKITKVEYIP